MNEAAGLHAHPVKALLNINKSVAFIASFFFSNKNVCLGFPSLSVLGKNLKDREHGNFALPTVRQVCLHCIWLEFNNIVLIEPSKEGMFLTFHEARHSLRWKTAARLKPREYTITNNGQRLHALINACHLTGLSEPISPSELHFWRAGRVESPLSVSSYWQWGEKNWLKWQSTFPPAGNSFLKTKQNALLVRSLHSLQQIAKSFWLPVV